MSALRHHRVTRDGVELHAVSQGQGPAVLLIHGFPQHSWMWRGLMERLAEAGFRAIALDQRGMGGSAIPAGGYDKLSLARDAAAVLDALEIPSASVVGYDHGGGTALALAFDQPARVERLVILEYAPPGYGYEYGLTAAPGNVNWQLALFTQPDVAVQFIAGKERELLAWYFWHWSHNPEAVSQADFEVYLRQLQKPGALRGGFAHFASVFEDMARFKAWGAAGKLAMPVLALGGAAAASAFPGMAMQQLAGQVTAEIIPEAGHWLMEEQPELMAGKIIAFCRG